MDYGQALVCILGLWRVNEKNEPVRVHNARVQVRYPPESKEGIWGGEGIIYGQRYARGGKEVM